MELFEARYSRHLLDLVWSCLEEEPDDRITAAELREAADAQLEVFDELFRTDIYPASSRIQPPPMPFMPPERFVIRH